MKKFLLTFLTIVCFLGCDKTIQPSHVVPTKSGKNFEYNIINMEGCEYIHYWAYANYAVTHKGNCTNHFKKIK